MIGFAPVIPPHQSYQKNMLSFWTTHGMVNLASQWKVFEHSEVKCNQMPFGQIEVEL